MSSSLSRLALLLVGLGVAAIAAFATASPVPAAPALIWRATITDAETGQAVAATILVDDAIVASDVSQADVLITADAQLHHLRVLADGYQPWSITLRGVTKDGRVLRGPVRLVPVPAQRA